jgi:DNA-binding IclR family transcriptional regulator
MIYSVKKAFDLIDLLAACKEPLSLADICRQSGLNKTTIFRYLHTLEQCRIIEKKGNYYFLGIRLFELGNKVHTKQLIVDKIHPIIKQLADEENETANLAQLSDNQVLYLDKIECKRSLQIQTFIGAKAPLYCTGLGKVILALFDEAACAAIVDSLKLDKVTPHTLSNKKDLLAQIQKIRQDGYGLDLEELEIGLKCIAVPLFLKNYNFYGAISLAGPSIRFTDETIVRLAGKLLQTAQKIKNAFYD